MIAAIRSDFLSWSGGFPPESFDQVFVYVETARPRESDPEMIKNLLETWMSEPDDIKSPKLQ